MKSLDGKGMHYVYVLHFDFPDRAPLHYKGKTDNLINRLRQHYKGEGSKTTDRYSKMGGKFTLVKLYEFNTSDKQSAFEREVKKKPSKKICSICMGANK